MSASIQAGSGVLTLGSCPKDAATLSHRLSGFHAALPVDGRPATTLRALNACRSAMTAASPQAQRGLAARSAARFIKGTHNVQRYW